MKLNQQHTSCSAILLTALVISSCNASTNTECTNASQKAPHCQASSAIPSSSADAEAITSTMAPASPAPATAPLTTATQDEPITPSPAPAAPPTEPPSSPAPAPAPAPAAPDVTPPVVGSALSFSSITATSVIVSWGAATDLVTPSGQLQYELLEAESLTDLSSLATGTSSATGTVAMAWSPNVTDTFVSSLTSGTTYYFAVLVKDAAGNQTAYSPSSVVPENQNPPTPGAGLSFPVVGTTTMSITWGTASDSATPSSQLTYKLVCVPLNQGSVATVNAIDAITTTAHGLVMDWTVNTTSAQATGLTASTTYACNVAVKDGAGNEAAYGVQNQTTTP